MIKMHVLRLLLAVNFLLLCVLVALWVTPQGKLRNVHWLKPSPQEPQFSEPGNGLPARSPALVGSFLVTLERPLFSPNRRPAPPPPAIAAVNPEPDPLANIQLQGVYSAGTGGGIFAKVDGKDRRIPVGSTLGAWTVKSVSGRDVVFERGEEVRVLQLVPSKLAVVAPVPPVPTAVAAGASKLSGMGGAQVEDPVIRQEQERQERERARLALRNARRAEQGFPPVKE